ncbi:RloB-like protein [Chitinophaga rupis]|uniref:RloB-like protein n=1 Tax=Chitinophaga rupis TaxID=573321 RepID=A0A1H7VZJ4_9BACT|nr:RloB family protein [Chitinophaga rupis]SEM14289.1 RloB-like protein [Chitinophaga rupis]
MPDAWELIPDSERKSDNLTTFILFCEDEVSEPSYFRQFQNPEKLKVNIAEGQKNSFRNITNAINYCDEKGLIENVNGNYKLKTGITSHIWCVFDRDHETHVKADVQNVNNIAFTVSIQAALNAGLNVAWSNDAFELWILLHFEDIDPSVWCHRNYVYDRLTSIFQNMAGQSPEMEAITKNEKFTYKESFKKKGNFLQYVLPHLSARQNDAIARAQALEASFKQTDAPHDCNPCTKVHHLVNSLLVCLK